MQRFFWGGGSVAWHPENGCEGDYHKFLTIKNYIETTFNDYSWQGNRGAVGKQGLPGEPGAQVRQDSDFYLTRRIGHSWLGWLSLSINRCIIFLQGQIGPRGENGEYGLTGEMVSSRKSVPCTFWGCSPYFIKNVFQALQIDPLRLYYSCTSHWFVTSLYIRYGKTGHKNVQLVSQHCCKLSWKAMLLVYQPRLKPVLQQISWLLQVSKSVSIVYFLYPYFTSSGDCTALQNQDKVVSSNYLSTTLNYTLFFFKGQTGPRGNRGVSGSQGSMVSRLSRKQLPQRG